MHSQKYGNYLEGLHRSPDNNDNLNQGSSHKEKVDERGKTRFGK